jgi:hypothetical protein
MNWDPRVDTGRSVAHDWATPRSARVRSVARGGTGAAGSGDRARVQARPLMETEWGMKSADVALTW